jgi:hypothetical protein
MCETTLCRTVLLANFHNDVSMMLRTGHAPVLSGYLPVFCKVKLSQHMVAGVGFHTNDLPLYAGARCECFSTLHWCLWIGLSPTIPPSQYEGCSFLAYKDINICELTEF